MCRRASRSFAPPQSALFMRLAQFHPIVVLSALLGVSGCNHLAPGTILEDRIPYNMAIVESWQQHTLLNIVRLHYLDVPEFVDVPSIVSGYENSRTASAAFSAEIYPRDSFATFLSPNLGPSPTMADRPTITSASQSG